MRFRRLGVGALIAGAIVLASATPSAAAAPVVIATIDLGSGNQLSSLALSPDGSTGYASSLTSERIETFSPASKLGTGGLTVDPGAPQAASFSDVAVGPAVGGVYPIYGVDDSNDALWVWSSSGSSVSTTFFDLSAGSPTLNTVAISADGALAIVTDPADDQILVVDLGGGSPAVSAVSGFGLQPWDVAFGPDGRARVTVAGDPATEDDAVVAEFNRIGAAPYFVLADTIPMDNPSTDPQVVAQYIAIAPDGIGYVTIVDVSDSITDLIGKFDATTLGSPLGTFPASDQPSALAVSPNSASLYVADCGCATQGLYGYSVPSGSLAFSLGIVDSEPSGIAVSPDGGTVYISDLLAGVVYVVDLGLTTVTPTLPPTGSSPAGTLLGAAALLAAGGAFLGYRIRMRRSRARSSGAV